MINLWPSSPFEKRSLHAEHVSQSGQQAKHSSASRILVIETGRSVSALFNSESTCRNFIVDSISASEVDLRNADTGYNIVIFDIYTHHQNGLALLKQLRQDRPVLPVLALTASTAVHERVELLQAGADDCLAKPFASAEFLARIDVLLRRSRSVIASSLKVGSLTLSRTSRHLQRNQRSITLTSREFAILDLLMQNPGRPISRATILREVWNLPPHSRTNIVEVYINYIRDKVESPGEPKLIRTIRRVGYQLVDA